MNAARGGKVESLRFLIDSKACLDIKDDIKMTALDFAQEGGHTECAELMIAVIEPRSQSVFNFTVVHPAVRFGSLCVTPGRTEK